MFKDFELDICIEDNRWEDFEDLQSRLEALATETFSAINWDRPCEISLLLTDDATIQDLNARYRGQDKPTNVLAFADQHEGPGPLLLGDIVISFDRLKEEAQTITVDDHFAHLFIHGLLHLLGYDHEEDVPAEEMEALETQILAKFSISNPHI